MRRTPPPLAPRIDRIAEPVIAGVGDPAAAGHPLDAVLDTDGIAAQDLHRLAFHNLDTLDRLADPRLCELLAVPEGDGRFAGRARFGADGHREGRGDWGRLSSAWRHCIDVFGPLEWDVAVYSSGHEWPRALSLPGAVLVSHRLPTAAVGTQWLYVLHELLHQWFGALVRLAPSSHARWEAWVDALAWTMAARVLGPSADPVYSTVYERQALTGDPALAERGSLVLAARRSLRGDDPGMERFAALTAEAGRRARAGLPRTIADAPPLDATKGAPSAV